MHPSPAAVTAMPRAELESYRREIVRLIAERGDDNGAYGERLALIDAALAATCPRSPDGDHKPDGGGAYCVYCNAPVS